MADSKRARNSIEAKVVCITTVDLSLRFLVFDFLKYLRAQNYSVTAVSAPGPYLADVEAAGVRVVPVPMSRRVTPLQDIVSFIRLTRVLVREQPSIVHTHTPKANLLGQWAARLAGCPYRVSTVHGLYFTPQTAFVKRTFFRLIEWFSALPAHIVFVINQQDLDTAARLRVINRDKLRLLPGGLGVNLRRFVEKPQTEQEDTLICRELGLPDGALVIGYVGRLVEEKGLLDLFAAFRRVMTEDPHAHLLLIGPFDAAKPDAISPSVADHYGISARTIFTGMRHDTPEIYSIMDVFVLPSYREGLPLSAMEAQAVGIPVVTTDARGCREVIDPDRTGLLVPAHDPSALADALLTLLHNPDLRHRMGAEGRKLAIMRFDQRIAFAAFEKAYMDLLTVD
jgi:glycosyltransferase involved in cell wall biosynthesis